MNTEAGSVDQSAGPASVFLGGSRRAEALWIAGLTFAIVTFVCFVPVIGGILEGNFLEALRYASFFGAIFTVLSLTVWLFLNRVANELHEFLRWVLHIVLVGGIAVFLAMIIAVITGDISLLDDADSLGTLFMIVAISLMPMLGVAVSTAVCLFLRWSQARA